MLVKVLVLADLMPSDPFMAYYLTLACSKCNCECLCASASGGDGSSLSVQSVSVPSECRHLGSAQDPPSKFPQTAAGVS